MGEIAHGSRSRRLNVGILRRRQGAANRGHLVVFPATRRRSDQILSAQHLPNITCQSHVLLRIMAIDLPKTPTGEQYEDYVAATLRANGYFIESRVVLREGGSEVLELDVVGTPSGPEYAKRELFEAKKTLGFGDLFKLYGQRGYLGIEAACLTSLVQPTEPMASVLKSKASEMGIRVVAHPLDAEPQNLAPEHNSLSKSDRAKVVEVAWYGHIAKRTAHAAFVKECKTHGQKPAFQAARTYDFNITSSFFLKEPLERAEALYNAYFAEPKLTGKLVSALGGNSVAVLRDVGNSEKFPAIQYIEFLEGTGRIAILKNILDDLIFRGGGELPGKTIKLGGDIVLKLSKHSLPQRYEVRAMKLQQHQHALRLPFFFQVFAELCGGFLVLDDKDELDLMEDLTGIPGDEIAGCLDLYDELFAPDNGTMFYGVADKLRCMKMIPGFIRGSGAFLRHELLGLKEYSRYGKAQPALVAWHNAAYRLLEPVLGK
jgi:hypothetical protein